MVAKRRLINEEYKGGEMHQITPIKAHKDNYIWSISNLETGYCVIVDPGQSEPILEYLKQSKVLLEAIIVTHHHWDHTDGIKGILEKFPVEVFTQSNVKNVIKFPNSKLEFNIIPVPGHTLDHIAFYSSGIVFTGDSLFTGGCGRVFEGSHEQMYNSLQQLVSLPDDTLVYCGHEYTEPNLKFALEVEPNNKDILVRIKDTKNRLQDGLPTVPSSISLEKKTNPFLRTDQPSIIESAEKHAKKPLKTPEEVFQALREWKDKF
jgi:hydroxyacylglutathione hydrolase